ncbi:hypothetical protein KHC23_13130 [Ancylobacter dichloromethanicus]|nr:hypothetical protein [Ancylobacter dichloromethanicus]MBS7554597.1 hypothetical protein [Ancylobacter dichloromethanicus]
MVAASEKILTGAPTRIQAARDAMSAIRTRMAADGAEPAALEALGDHIRLLDTHLRRRCKALLKPVCNEIE